MHGAPRHPQSQGLVEQGNSVLKQKLTAFTTNSLNVNIGWRRALPCIIGTINQQAHTSLNGRQPFVAFFNCRPIRYFSEDPTLLVVRILILLFLHFLNKTNITLFLIADGKE